jgi:hypothetical protein
VDLVCTAVTLITIIRIIGSPLRHQNQICGEPPIADHSRHCLSAIEKLLFRKGSVGFESNGPGVCWNHRRLDKWRIWTRIVAIPEILPIGVLHFPGTGIQDNLADKAEKLGIPVLKFGAG